jgi:hypothetical protein
VLLPEVVVLAHSAQERVKKGFKRLKRDLGYKARRVGAEIGVTFPDLA